MQDFYIEPFSSIADQVATEVERLLFVHPGSTLFSPRGEVIYENGKEDDGDDGKEQVRKISLLHDAPISEAAFWKSDTILSWFLDYWASKRDNCNI